MPYRYTGRGVKFEPSRWRVRNKVDGFDFVIVGAGSAGCVLADRLSADQENRVCLIEAGGSDRSPFVQMPSAISIVVGDKRLQWGYVTEPESFLGGRRLECPRGKLLGGSSSINAMAYVRGHPCDFEEWEQCGATGWGYQNCLPYFRRAERWMGGADEYRGNSGPLVTCNGNGMKNPLYRAFIEAGAQAGYSRSADYNGFQQEGFCALNMTIKDGVRCSTSNSYLRPALRRRNLDVRSNAHARRVVFEGKRAVGVEYEIDGTTRIVRAEREVILSAGSIGSPALLQLSGVGPEAVLAAAGVPVLHDLPGVGANLQDHLEAYLQYACLKPITLNSKMGLFQKALIGTRWLLFKSGLGATNHMESGGFIRSRPGVRWPDVQYHFFPVAMSYAGGSVHSDHGFMVCMSPTKPESRGWVRIVSPDPRDQPQIQFNYLERERDRADWRACLRLTREIVAQPAMDSYRSEEISPGSAVQTDEQVDEWIKESVSTAYHPSSTCKIGKDQDLMAVLDPELRVRGVQALRVVDASVFPTVTNGNLNAPTIMVAERAADIIAGRELLAPSNAPFFLDDLWETRQRQGEPVRAVLTDD